MKAVELTGFEGLESFRLVEVDKPKPSANEILMQVKATGINFAEIEMTNGKYPAARKLPFVMGFEAAGIVVEAGPNAKNVKVGDKVAAVVSSGGYAEYATADANRAIPIPDGISFAQATTIPIQGLTAYTMLKVAAKPQPDESVLIQAAAGGVGIYLVQLAKIFGVRRVIALAGSDEKTQLVKSLGANVAISYSKKNWPQEVREATGGGGLDVVWRPLPAKWEKRVSNSWRRSDGWWCLAPETSMRPSLRRGSSNSCTRIRPSSVSIFRPFGLSRLPNACPVF